MANLPETGIAILNPNLFVHFPCFAEVMFTFTEKYWLIKFAHVFLTPHSNLSLA